MKRPITFISIISIFLFLAAIVWVGTGIFVEKSTAGQQTQAKFDTLLLKTATASAQCKYGTPEFSKQFLNAIENISDYSALKLEINGQLVYSYPPSTFSLPSSDLVKTYRNTVTAADGTNITLTATMFLLKSSSIYNYSRFAFMLILVGTMIAILLLMLLREPKNKNQEKPFEFNYDPDLGDDMIFEDEDEAAKISESEEANQAEETAENEEKIESENNFFDNLENQQNIDEEALNELNEEEISIDFNQLSEPEKKADDETTETAEASTIFQPEPENGESYAENENSFGNEFDLEEETEEDYLNQIEEYKNSVANEEFEKTTEEEPIFQPNQFENVSPITGLKVQSALNDDLAQNISETLVNQKDLTIALLKVNGLDRGNSISNDVVEVLKNNLSNSFEIYEYNSDSYAIILKEADLNSCVDDFDKIYQEVTDFLKTNNAANEVTIGISSVNGRNVDSERLLSEAALALVHADEDPDSPIIAFRANPEKFKEFMENQ
ncbi:MAG: hypothetical protein KBT11_10305 [Treponema sp.]|nr:hypothetical protein [Candidatus Treponema equifaecale]